MSFWNNMFKRPEKGYTSWLLQVGTFPEDIIIYKLDAEGKPVNFVCGGIKQVIGGPLRELGPYIGIVDYRKIYGIVADRPRRPYFLGFRRCWRWADLVKLLNGKGIGAAAARERCRILRSEIGLEIPELAWDESVGWKLGEAGREADARMDEIDNAAPVPAGNGQPPSWPDR